MEGEQQALLGTEGVAQDSNRDEVQTQPAPKITKASDAFNELRQGIQREHELKLYNSTQHPGARHGRIIRDSSVSPAFQEVHSPAVTAPPPRLFQHESYNDFSSFSFRPFAARGTPHYPWMDNDQLISPDNSAHVSPEINREAEDEHEDRVQFGVFPGSEYHSGPLGVSSDFRIPTPQDSSESAGPPLADGYLFAPEATFPSYDETAGKPAKKVGENQCPHCNARFTRAHNLKSHLLTHSQEKPFVCDSCSKRFRRLHDLQRHQKLHTGKRPFACDKCDRKFARADGLRRHKRTACKRTKKDSDGEDDMDFVDYAVKEHHAAAMRGEERVQGALPSTDVDIEMEEEASPLSVSRKRNRDEDEFTESIAKRPRTDTPSGRAVDTESKVSSPKCHNRVQLELEQSPDDYVEVKKGINRRGPTVRVQNDGRGTGGMSFSESANPYSSLGSPVDERVQTSPPPPAYLQRSDILPITEESMADPAREARPNVASQASILHPMVESSQSTAMQETANRSQLHLSNPSAPDYNTAQFASGATGFSAMPHPTNSSRLRRRRLQPSTSSFEGDREFQGRRRSLTPENPSLTRRRSYLFENFASAHPLLTTSFSTPRDPGTPSSTGGSGSSSDSRFGELVPGTPNTSVSGGSGLVTPVAPTQPQSQHSQAGAANPAGDQTTGSPSPNPRRNDASSILGWFKADSTTTLLIDILLLLAIAAQVTAIAIYIMSKPMKGDGRPLDPDFLTLVSNCLIQLAGLYITQRGMKKFTEAKDPYLLFNLCLVLASSFVLGASALGLYFLYTTLGDSLMTLAGLLQVWSWKMMIYRKREDDDTGSVSQTPSGVSNIPTVALPRGQSPCQ